MKTEKKKMDKLQKALKQHAKKKGESFVMDTMTYTWKPPTPEQLAAQVKAKRQSDHDKMREIAMYLEGVKNANIGSRITHEHMNVLWSSVAKMYAEISK